MAVVAASARCRDLPGERSMTPSRISLPSSASSKTIGTSAESAVARPMRSPAR